MAKNIFIEEICDGVLCEAAESFEEEACSSFLGIKSVHQFVDLCALLFLLTACKIHIIKQMKKPKLCNYTVIKHSGHLRTLEKCTKHSPAALVFYLISLVFSSARRVLSLQYTA